MTASASLSMPHYVLDARTATPHFPGIGRYVSNLAEALVPALAADERLTVVALTDYPLRLPARPAVQTLSLDVSPFSLRQQWVMPRRLRELEADLYHSPYYLMPFRLPISGIVTIHDLIPMIFPEHSSLRARRLFHYMIALALRASAQTIAVSDATRKDFLTHFPVSGERVSVIPEAADPNFTLPPEASVHDVRQRYHLWEPFVLYLGSNKPHKNLVRLVEAWAQVAPVFPETKLVIAGSWIPTHPEPRLRAEELGLTDRAIRWLGPLPEQDLPALYRAAQLFVFPSRYEGFGLPVIEAMACGAPVACSNVSSMPEVAGDSALLFDPESAASMAETITRALEDEGLREELRQMSLARAATFSWQRTAQETLDLYRSVIG